ncbi:MAG TPA: hypothetical protein VMU48_17330 [Terracidiphilus sp.]|nr:hypothetical protein [Terracidiphilus sp.]
MRNASLFLGRTLSSITVLLWLTSFVAGQPTISSDKTSPVSVIRKYCELDLEGARLSSENPNADEITALATWRIEPGWDTSVVVSAFEIENTSLGPKESRVTVRYVVLGKMFGAKVAPAQQHKELVTFVLKESSGGWLIERPLIAPHVSVSAAISALKSLLIDEKDPEQIRRLNAGIAALTRWKSEAGPSKSP